MDENSLEFDMVGIDAAIANAFRRILLAEVLGRSCDQDHHLHLWLSQVALFFLLRFCKVFFFFFLLLLCKLFLKHSLGSCLRQ